MITTESLVLNQILIMFILMGFGYFIYRTNLMNEQGIRQVSNVLVFWVAPITILSAFNSTTESLQWLKFGLTIVLSMGVLLLGLLIGYVVYGTRNPLARFAVTFSNAGFMGIPLVMGLLGASSVIYLSGFLVCYNLMVWTFGVRLMRSSERLTLIQIIRNPAIIGTLLGLLLYSSSIKLPLPVSTAVGLIGSMNTPLAMLVLGTMIARTNLKNIILSGQAFWVSFIRLILIPILVLLGLKWVPQSFLEIKLVILIAASAPVGSMVGIFAQLYDQDGEQASRYISLSTILCLFSIPFILYLSKFIWMEVV